LQKSQFLSYFEKHANAIFTKFHYFVFQCDFKIQNPSLIDRTSFKISDKARFLYLKKKELTRLVLVHISVRYAKKYGKRFRDLLHYSYPDLLKIRNPVNFLKGNLRLIRFDWKSRSIYLELRNNLFGKKVWKCPKMQISVDLWNEIWFII
jgi:hypothetical protein